MSALTAALAASVRAPHASAAAAAGHTIWIDEEPAGWRASCIPHGDLGLRRSHLAAMCAAVQHDMDEGGQGE